jgi:hypothetical protein
MSNWIEHLDELASVETDIKKKVAFQSSARLIKDLAKGGAELRAELAALRAENVELASKLKRSLEASENFIRAVYKHRKQDLSHGV